MHSRRASVPVHGVETRSYVAGGDCQRRQATLHGCAWVLKMMCIPQPPNTPVSIKTGNTLLSVAKAEAGPNADGCITPESVWIPSGLRIACLRMLGVRHQKTAWQRTQYTRRACLQTRTAAACTWLGTRVHGS